MSDPFLVDEASVEDSQPREFYKIVQSEAVTYFIASGDRDVVYDGDTYVAEPIARTEVGLASTGDFALSVRLPLSHGLCQRYLSASPPIRVFVTVYRKQLNSGVVEVIWQGNVTSLAANMKDHVADFQIPSRLSRAIGRLVPSIICSPTCPHVLYDRNCRADDTSFKVSTTVTFVNGRTAIVASISPFIGDDTFFPFGDLLHVPTGERMTIFEQSNLTMQMQQPIPDMKAGDAVVLRAGCAHDVGTCHAKFDNQVNFGGQPQIPTTDLWMPGNGIGIWGS